jgi:hypothetical protein
MIEMGKKYTTRDGRAVRILCTDLKGRGELTVSGLVANCEGSEYECAWMANGATVASRDDPSDLIPVPTKHEGWIMVTDDLLCVPPVYQYKEVIDDAAQFMPKPVHVAHVTWES